jgi:hydrogenase maturation protease
LQTNNTLVLGIGNTLLSDEGVGIHMLGYLREHFPELSGVSFLDGGTLSFTLAPWIEEADNVVVVDAAELNSSPGAMQVFEGDALDRFAGKTKRSVHEVSLGDLLQIARLTDALPRNRALVAIQPGNIDWGPDLSDPVTRALPAAAHQVVCLTRKWTPKKNHLAADRQVVYG